MSQRAARCGFGSSPLPPHRRDGGTRADPGRRRQVRRLRRKHGLPLYLRLPGLAQGVTIARPQRYVRVPMTKLTRFAVAPLHSMTRRLADVASARVEPDLVVTGARVLS